MLDNHTAGALKPGHALTRQIAVNHVVVRQGLALQLPHLPGGGISHIKSGGLMGVFSVTQAAAAQQRQIQHSGQGLFIASPLLSQIVRYASIVGGDSGIRFRRQSASTSQGHLPPLTLQ